MRYRCKTCLGTYSDILADGMQYFHACAPEIITHAQFDLLGIEITPESRTPRTVVRNENLRAPARAGKTLIISGGAGVDQVEEGDVL